MLTVNQVLNTLRNIKLTNSTENLLDSNLVRNISIEQGKVSFEIILAPQVTPNLNQIKATIEHIEGVTSVSMKRIAYTPKTHSPQKNHSLKGVKNIIAISSCKGGVGKSTIAAHIAQEFASRGIKTGLLDADIYGPSIPTLFNIHHPDIQTTDQKKLCPVNVNKLKLMSFGFLLGDAPAVMRGPIVTRYIQQMLFNTEWGELDYLFIDMPPGTGDVHLTITQSIRLTGAVIVTTPHTLSMIDVARGILMFEKVKVPIIGVIENMAFFEDPKTSVKHYLFGQTSAQKLQKQFGIDTLSEIPILKGLNAEVISNAYIQKTCDAITGKMSKLNEKDHNLPVITFDQSNVKLKWDSGDVWRINNRTLRLNSKDALSVDEMTGKRLINENNIRRDIAPKEIMHLGNYAIGITWNDGHSAGIYPYTLLESICEKEVESS